LAEGIVAEYSEKELVLRFRALTEVLEELPAEAQCPWPIARLFNELIKQARGLAEDDSVLKTIRYLEEGDSGNSGTVAVAVRALVGQAIISLDGGSDGTPSPSPSTRRRAAADRS
jgi:hypothetical protein